jgi:hypothetical protein
LYEGSRTTFSLLAAFAAAFLGFRKSRRAEGFICALLLDRLTGPFFLKPCKPITDGPDSMLVLERSAILLVASKDASLTITKGKYL